jgi:dihydroorotase
MIKSTHKSRVQIIARWSAVIAIFVAMNAYAQSSASAPPVASSAPIYDLLLQGGHVLDDKNHMDATMDVAVKDGKIAKVATHISPSDALKTIDVKGLYVTPGLIDIHVHVYAGTGERNSYAGDNSVPPDGFTFRVGVTTVVDAGCSGWRNFEDFKQAHHRSFQDTRLRNAQHRWRRHART